MKRKVTSTLISAVIGLSMANSALASGTIHYKGNIIESICTVNVNGMGESATVDLGEFSTGDMSDGMDYTDATSFNIKVAECPTSAVDHTTITMSGTAWADNSKAFYISEAGGGLGIKIKNADDDSIVAPNEAYSLTIEPNVENQFDYKANLYVAYASLVQPGDISTTLTINVAMD